ncbi:hypothetical protein A0H81_01539 [Grifola frondosa]|uniref:F-box domain-containing protein n=1 Tax=Grifola frondosa TaxID=5627 RepID=A0A1C7MSU8_GRIFR|nr:hypothetical protein A0H81_01539 [Grifola frondosa]
MAMDDSLYSQKSNPAVGARDSYYLHLTPPPSILTFPDMNPASQDWDMMEPTLGSDANGSMTSSPIHHLPHELLAHIFLFLAHMSPVGKYILRICHVCKHWRAVALSSADLWTSISFHDLDRAQTFLRRSKSRPIQVYLDRKRLPDSTVNILTPHVYRIQSLHVALRNHYELEDLLLGLKHTAAPRLEELVLHMGHLRCGWTSNWELADLLNTAIPVERRSLSGLAPFDSHTPMLRSLTLSHLRFYPWTASIYKHLIHLTIIAPPPPVAVQGLLDVLTGCPALETLVVRLSHFFSSFNTDTRPDFGRVGLGHLQSIEILHHHPLFVGTLFAHLSIPTRCCISIASSLPYASMGWDSLATIVRGIDMPPDLGSLRRLELDASALPVDPPTFAPPISRPASALRRMGRVLVQLRMYEDADADAPRAQPRFALSVKAKNTPRCMHGLWHALGVFGGVEVCAVSDVFWAAGDHHDFWARALGAMPRLHTLRVLRVPPGALIALLQVLKAGLAQQLARLVVVGAGGDAMLQREFAEFVRGCARARPAFARVDVLEAEGWTAEYVGRLRGLADYLSGLATPQRNLRETGPALSLGLAHPP